MMADHVVAVRKLKLAGAKICFGRGPVRVAGLLEEVERKHQSLGVYLAFSGLSGGPGGVALTLGGFILLASFWGALVDPKPFSRPSKRLACIEAQHALDKVQRVATLARRIIVPSARASAQFDRERSARLAGKRADAPCSALWRPAGSKVRQRKSIRSASSE